MKPFANELKERYKTLKCLDVGVYSYKLGWCEMQLGSAGAYNDHIRDIHGVKTEIQESEDHDTSNPDQDNSTQESPDNEGTTKALKVMVPTLKRINANTGKYIQWDQCIERNIAGSYCDKSRKRKLKIVACTSCLLYTSPSPRDS